MTEPASGQTLVRFTRNWSRVRCVDSRWPTQTALEAIEIEIRKKAGWGARIQAFRISSL